MISALQYPGRDSSKHAPGAGAQQCFCGQLQFDGPAESSWIDDVAEYPTEHYPQRQGDDDGDEAKSGAQGNVHHQLLGAINTECIEQLPAGLSIETHGGYRDIDADGGDQQRYSDQYSGNGEGLVEGFERNAPDIRLQSQLKCRELFSQRRDQGLWSITLKRDRIYLKLGS